MAKPEVNLLIGTNQILRLAKRVKKDDSGDICSKIVGRIVDDGFEKGSESCLLGR